MLDITTLTSFFGWCSVINIGLLTFTTAILWLLGDWARSIQSRMFSVDKDTLSDLYITWLGNFKLAIIVFNIVPYFALKLMA